MGRVSTAEVVKELNKIKKAAASKYEVERMLLFGSRARGEELLTSDVDVIVVSQDFSGVPFRKRPDRFIDMWRLPVDLEILCYSPEELERKKKEIGLVREALKTCREI